jgi:adenylate kinase
LRDPGHCDGPIVGPVFEGLPTMPADRAAWTLGGEARCRGAGPAPRREWRVVLLGPPGVGKGTQAALLARQLAACPLSMGDVIRQGGLAVIRSQAMTSALDHLERGELVPDQIVLALLGERQGCLRCPAGHGFVLDGFPRTRGQAQELERQLHARQVTLDAVVSYQLSIDTIVTRLADRRVCPACGAIYHLQSLPPHVPGHCDRCATVLERRADDLPRTIRNRMTAFQDTVEPLIDFYRKRGVLVSIAAQGTPEEILARTLSAPPFAGAVAS